MVEIERTPTAAEKTIASHVEALPADDPLRDTRQAAFGAFARDGLPHRRVEEWKYTDLRAQMREVPDPAMRPDPSRASEVAGAVLPIVEGASRLVFVDGHYFPDLSTVPSASEVEVSTLGQIMQAGGAVLDRLRTAQWDGRPILALNGIYAQDGAILRIRSGQIVDAPIEIVHLATGDEAPLCAVRHAVVVEPGAQATIIERFLGPDGIGYHVNAVSDLHAMERSKLRWVKIQREGDAALHLATMISRVDKETVFDPFLMNVGAGLSRTECELLFEGTDAQAGMRGVTLARGRQHADVTLMVDHAVPDCVSREFFKAAVGGEATAVFQGKILVRQDAQKTDGQMMSQALLLSEGATFNNKPELEIFADDVQCAHGATCGELDENLLFYLLSRGIDPQQARRLLILAFLAEAIEEAELGPVGEALEELSAEWLSSGTI